ncbi:MAG: DNA-binding protein [Desulfovibrio sp.]|nr:MAG: DNA-binding protein [Desulfovibrio sp.]
MSLLSFTPDTDWTCGKCGGKLTPSPVDVEYLGNVFNVELLGCAKCGLVLIPEDLALGKMFEVEQLLEDK